MPLRTGLFLGTLALALDVSFELSGIPAALLLLLVFIPFVWGLGMIGAAAVLTFKRGGGLVGIVATAIIVTSGAYFPLTLLPAWIRPLAEANPVGLAFEGTRQALLGGAGVGDVIAEAGMIAVWALGAIGVGHLAGVLALARERRRGTLVTY